MKSWTFFLPLRAPREISRELVKPTGCRKKHALVLQRDTPLALISLRRRQAFWEPVSYQALPGYIAPTMDIARLGRAINLLGLDVRVEAGLGPEAIDLHARQTWSYEVNQVALQDNYEEFWRANSQRQMRQVKRARSRCADFNIAVDQPSDLDWILDTWRDTWAADPSQETVVTEDRRRFWKAVKAASYAPGQFGIHWLQLFDRGKRVAGIVHSRHDDKLIFQCTARHADYDRMGVGVRVMDASIQWAAGQGFKVLDLGGGGYKNLWGPVAGRRYGAVFCPPLIHVLKRLEA